MTVPALLNIGNTHVELKMPDSGEIRISLTKDFTADSIPDCPCAACCVVPACYPALREKNVFLVTPETASSLMDFSGVNASTIGGDRIANAAALIAGGTLPAVSLDAGTAITMEIIAPGNRFLGGMIAPGRAMMRRMLNTGTGLLPEIPFTMDLPPFPGTNTVDAIRGGTDMLTLDGIRSSLERIRGLFPGRQVRFAVCGGDAAFFRKHLPFLEETSPGFTLEGVLAVYRSHFG